MCPHSNSGGGEGITPAYGLVSFLGLRGSLEMPLLVPRCPADADCWHPQPTKPIGRMPSVNKTRWPVLEPLVLTGTAAPACRGLTT